MIVQCPDCSTKMRPTVPLSLPEGTRISVTCRCGTKLRFRMPGKPKATVDESIRSIFGDDFGAGK